MNKRILLAWELGGGRGHAYILSWIARALKERGYEPVLAVQQLNILESVRADIAGMGYLQAPIWPGLRDAAPYKAPGPTVTLGDIIADLGLSSPSATEQMVHAWDRLIAVVDPAVLIANFAPGALLAGRGRLPTIATGEGFTLPPTTMDNFLNFNENAEQPKYDESKLLEIVNDCLRSMQRPPRSRLPEIFAADRSCVAAFTEFDPYAEFRRQPNAGPWAPRWDRAIRKEKTEIFGYFSIRVPFEGLIVRALSEVVKEGIPVRVHMPQLNAEQQSYLAEVGVMVERTPLPFEEIHRRARLVVSLGSFSFVSCALAAGIPQIVFPLGIAKHVTGKAIEQIGVGRWLEVNSQNPLEPALLAQALIEAYRDEKIAAKAKELAPDFERRLEPRPEDVVAQLVDELV